MEYSEFYEMNIIEISVEIQLKLIVLMVYSM